MDIEQLRTFLEVNRTRHFRVAAEALFLTQSAVSARIKKLEDELGVALFERQNRDIRLTPQGHRLLRHAESIIAIWRRARQDVALAEEAKVQLAVGGLFSLWDIVLQQWIQNLHRDIPNLSLAVEVHDHEALLRRLLDGVLDLVFIYEAPQLEEILLQEIKTIPIIMVSSKAGQSAAHALKNNYVMVDWGDSFRLQHARIFPGAPAPSQRANQARLALTFILNCGGASYLPEPMVENFLQNSALYRIADAPPILRHAYAAYSRRSAYTELIQQVLNYF